MLHEAPQNFYPEPVSRAKAKEKVAPESTAESYQTAFFATKEEPSENNLPSEFDLK